MSNSHSGDIDKENFWETVIGANSLSSAEDVRDAMDSVKRRLAATSPATASEFDRWLSRQLYLLDRKEFFDLPAITADNSEYLQTDDSFLYARCACVLAGREAVTEVLNGRHSFTDFSKIPLLGAEFLLYAAEEICNEVFGTEIVRLDSWPLVTGSNREYWPSRADAWSNADYLFSRAADGDGQCSGQRRHEARRRGEVPGAVMTVGQGRAVPMSGGSVSLESWGRLEVSGTSTASVETVSGDVVELPPDVARDLGTTLFWLDELDGLLLLIPRIRNEIVRVDLREGAVHEVERLVRDEDEDIRFASAQPGPGGTLLVLYERGLVCLAPCGAVRWHALHDDLSAEIVAVDGDRVVLRQQWPTELAGRERRYSLLTGELLP